VLHAQPAFGELQRSPPVFCGGGDAVDATGGGVLPLHACRASEEAPAMMPMAARPAADQRTRVDLRCFFASITCLERARRMSRSFDS
jgi:hypothetical protein